MARASAILKALATAVRRDAAGMASFTGNNLFFVAVLLLFLDDPGAFVSLNGLLALVLFFPLTADPLRKIPPDRLGLWPLGRRERWLLRALSPWLNPMTWLIVVLVVRRTLSVGLSALLVALFVAGFLASSRNFGSWRWMPPLPGPLGQLVRKNLREMLSTLDFCCALFLSGITLAFRIAGMLPRAALFPMTLMVVLTLSTYAQCLFGLDRMTRYRLLPVAGWQILAAKDAAFLLIAVLLCLPLDPIAAFSASLAVLAIGHHASVRQRREQSRWRFSSGPFASGMLQVLFIGLAASAVQYNLALILACIALYAASAWYYGRALEMVSDDI